MTQSENPFVDDRTVAFLLDEVLDLRAHLTLSYFADHDREGIEVLLDVARKLARRVLYPSYRLQDAHPAELRDGRVHLHPSFHAVWPSFVATGLLAATRPTEHGGQQLPFLVHAVAAAYLGAANLNVVGLAMLTTGAAHLIEAFGDDEQRAAWMAPLYEGRWTGTMALTEPQAGSSTTMTLAQRGIAGDVEGMLLHSTDYLELASIVVVAWQHLLMATAAREGLTRGGPQVAGFYEGKLRSAAYWFGNELPRVATLTEVCVRPDESYRAVPDSGW